MKKAAWKAPSQHEHQEHQDKIFLR
jgi:hypothetical protein